MKMGDVTTDFFNTLRRRGHEPFLRNTTGTVRFDLSGGDRVETWYLTVTSGDIAVSNSKADADAVVSCDRALMNGMLVGEINAMAAALRGVIVPQGDLGLVLSVARLFRGAHDAWPGAHAAGYAQRKR
jgi:putative sterol carrier protein